MAVSRKDRNTLGYVAIILYQDVEVTIPCLLSYRKCLNTVVTGVNGVVRLRRQSSLKSPVLSA